MILHSFASMCPHCNGNSTSATLSVRPRPRAHRHPTPDTSRGEYDPTFVPSTVKLLSLADIAVSGFVGYFAYFRGTRITVDGLVSTPWQEIGIVVLLTALGIAMIVSALVFIGRLYRWFPWLYMFIGRGAAFMGVAVLGYSPHSEFDEWLSLAVLLYGFVHFGCACFAWSPIPQPIIRAPARFTEYEKWHPDWPSTRATLARKHAEKQAVKARRKKAAADRAAADKASAASSVSSPSATAAVLADDSTQTNGIPVEL